MYDEYIGKSETIKNDLKIIQEEVRPQTNRAPKVTKKDQELVEDHFKLKLFE